MDVHKNARLTPRGREALVRRVVAEGRRGSAAAADFGVTVKTVRKWLERYRDEGPAGLRDRPSTPHRSPNATAAATVSVVLDLRRARLSGAEIAARTTLSKATVARILRRHGLARLRALVPSEPARRYERQAPGELVHLDIKKLGRIVRPSHRVTGDRRDAVRGAGWEFVHVAIDDHARLAYAEILADERQASAVAFLEHALAWFQRLGVTVERIMTDNGAAYRARTFAAACHRHGLRHLFTRPYTPRTNGKAERFIQTALREWSYATSYATSDQRRAALAPWLHRYNWHRPHMSLAANPPISRLRLTEDNLMRVHS